MISRLVWIALMTWHTLGKIPMLCECTLVPVKLMRSQFFEEPFKIRMQTETQLKCMQGVSGIRPKWSPNLLRLDPEMVA